MHSLSIPQLPQASATRRGRPRLRLRKTAGFAEARGEEGTGGLLSDQRGATMVIGVFFAVLLVGMIYYVWGLGDAVMHRERMSDAADTAAFSAAVIHARGMNMIALLNMVMAALAAVAATMATIASMIGSAGFVALVACLAEDYSACPYIATYGEEYADALDTSSDTTDRIETLLTGMHGYAVGIRHGVPLAAQAKVVSYGVDVYSPVTQLGIMAPLRTSMPVEDDDSDWPCDEKVLPPTQILSPIGVWAFASPSYYLLGGIGLGWLRAPSHARKWCDDGYFQRVTSQEMGSDAYQVQAYMIGDHDLEWSQEGVGIATWGVGRDEGELYTTLAQMGRVSFAQAEYFYDDSQSGFIVLHEGDWHEWMWHMRWRARLRRFRLSASGFGSLMDACGGSAACGALGGLDAIDGVVVH